MTNVWRKNLYCLLVVGLTTILLFNTIYLIMGQQPGFSSVDAMVVVSEEDRRSISLLVLEQTNPSVALAVTTLQEALEDAELSFSLTYVDDFCLLPISSATIFRPTDDIVIIGHGSPLGLRDTTQRLSWSAVKRTLAQLRYQRMVFLACYSQRGIPQHQIVNTLGFKDLVDAEAGALFTATLLTADFDMPRANVSPIMELVDAKQREMCHPLVETISINGEETWLFGINYPWWHYGSDWYAGSNYEFFSHIEADFRVMHTMGVHVVRWWFDVHGNDFISINPTPNGYRENAIIRLKWLLEYLCPKYEIYLIPTLFTHHFKYTEFNTDPQWREDLITHTSNLAFIFPSQSYPYLLAWDLWNEPEGSVSGWDPNAAVLSYATLRSFLNSLAVSLKDIDPNCYVTLGDGGLLSDPVHWDLSNIDFVSHHHYWDHSVHLPSIPTNFGLIHYGRKIPVLLGEYGGDQGDVKNDPLQTLAISRFTQEAYDKGYIGVLPWNYIQDVQQNGNPDWGFISDLTATRTANNDLYWRDRAHVFRAFEDDYWEEVTPGIGITTSRTDFSSTDWNYDNVIPRIWAYPSNYQFVDENDNMLFTDVLYVDLFVNIPEDLNEEDEIWVTLVYSAGLDPDISWQGYIRQKLSSGSYHSVASFWTYDKFNDRWTKTFKLINDYDDASPSSGTNVKLRIKPLLEDPVTLKLWSGQVWILKEDRDDDGLSDYEEYFEGTNPNNPDTDGDELTDGDEVHIYFTDPTLEDTDGDGLTDYEEVVTYQSIYPNLDPNDPDTDNDTLSDGAEVHSYSTDPTLEDTDSDDLTDYEEIVTYQSIYPNLDPNDPDTDNDTLSDGAEVHIYFTDPTLEDTDEDELSDGDEVHIYSTDPTLEDSDGDELSDGDEVHIYFTDPTLEDTDGDGLTDYEEVITYQSIYPNLDPNDPDTDNDTLSDGAEVHIYFTDPTLEDTDGDGLTDYEEVITYQSIYPNLDPNDPDSDGDQLLDGEEVYVYQTDPTLKDTDADLLTDYEEVMYEGTDPIDADTDDDGVNDGDEITYGTDPLVEDTDNDGLIDGYEVDHGLDPLLPQETGTSTTSSSKYTSTSFIGLLFVILTLSFLVFLVRKRKRS
ncbi:MAG: hypothetical protein ACFFDI_02355 [Promethearchaeota archaeon]